MLKITLKTRAEHKLSTQITEYITLNENMKELHNKDNKQTSYIK